MQDEKLSTLFETAHELSDRHCPGRIITRIMVHYSDGSLFCIQAEPRRSILIATHSQDFRRVNWYGREYELTTKQSMVVQMLWQAHKNGTESVSEEALLQYAESKTRRLINLFRRSEAWNTLIVHGRRGMFRLADPPKQPTSARPY